MRWFPSRPPGSAHEAVIAPASDRPASTPALYCLAIPDPRTSRCLSLPAACVALTVIARWLHVPLAVALGFDPHPALALLLPDLP